MVAASTSGQTLPSPDKLASAPKIFLASASVIHFFSMTACRKANLCASWRLPLPSGTACRLGFRKQSLMCRMMRDNKEWPWISAQKVRVCIGGAEPPLNAKGSSGIMMRCQFYSNSALTDSFFGSVRGHASDTHLLLPLVFQLCFCPLPFSVMLATGFWLARNVSSASSSLCRSHRGAGCNLFLNFCWWQAWGSRLSNESSNQTSLVRVAVDYPRLRIWALRQNCRIGFELQIFKRAGQSWSDLAGWFF